MKYLIYFNKFEINPEKLKSKLGKVIEFSSEKAIVEAKLDDLLKLDEIDKIIELKTEFKKLNFKTLKEDALKYIKQKNYFIKTDFLSKIPISAKSIYKHINPYLKHEGFIVNENYDELLYIEIIKIDGKPFYRLGVASKNMYEKQNAIKTKFNNYIVIIEEPQLQYELQDFIRVCWIFKIPLHLLTKDKPRMEKMLSTAIKEVKGVSQSALEIKVIQNLPKDFIKIGFTKHSLQNEIDLQKIKSERIALIFGNDKYGLSQDIRDELDFSIHLGPQSEKPFRGSQALSYILGFLSKSI